MLSQVPPIFLSSRIHPRASGDPLKIRFVAQTRPQNIHVRWGGANPSCRFRTNQDGVAPRERGHQIVYSCMPVGRGQLRLASKLSQSTLLNSCVCLDCCCQLQLHIKDAIYTSNDGSQAMILHAESTGRSTVGTHDVVWCIADLES